jgi:LmbE family N-acetylglucosaminyl deacetylase
MIYADDFEKIFKRGKRVLAVFAHPDDTELLSGGLISRLTKEGIEVRSVKMTYAEKGCRDKVISSMALKKIRMEEDRKAMKILGVKEENNVCLDLGDGMVENNLRTIEKLSLQIRIFRPDLIITHNPEEAIITHPTQISWVNHRDHRNTAQTVLDAAYPYARDLLFFPGQLRRPDVRSHAVKEFLFAESYSNRDLVYVKTGKYLGQKIKSLACHKSQYSLQKSEEACLFFTNYHKRNGFEAYRYVKAD